MFTGIIQGFGIITAVDQKIDFLRLTVQLSPELLGDLKLGASVSVSGVCLTAASINDKNVTFDVIKETLDKTTLGQLQVGDAVNIERSLKAGDELGGHIVSGHVHDTVEIVGIEKTENNHVLTLEPRTSNLLKYIFPKGFIALDGTSLTVVDVSQPRTSNLEPSFSVSLIPETLKRTTFGTKTVGDKVNIEVDQQTRTIVDTLERINPPLGA